MKPISLLGKLFYYIDYKICNNFKVFLIRKCHSVDVVFLMLYTFLQLILLISSYLFNEYIKIIIGIFIILFLFLISLEKIIIKFKSKISTEEKDNIEKQYYELKEENIKLRKNYTSLIKRHKLLIEQFTEVFKKNRRLK